LCGATLGSSVVSVLWKRFSSWSCGRSIVQKQQ
jgi:hypothetical protein